MSIVAPSPTSVYLYRDAHGILIYVGITSRGIKRNREHSETKSWWSFVASQEVEHYTTRDEATARERSLIESFTPPFNVQHNKDHALMRAAYLEFLANRTAFPSLQEAIAALPEKRLPLVQHQIAGVRNLILRTRIEDAQIAMALQLPEQVRAYGFKKRPTSVQRIQKVGPFALLWLGREARQPVASAWTSVKCDVRRPSEVALMRGVQVQLSNDKAVA